MQKALNPPPFPLNFTSKPLASSPLSADVMARESTNLRAKDATESAEMVRRVAIQMLQRARQLGGAAMGVTADALRALMRWIQALMRFFARVFGVLLSKRETAADAEKREKAELADKGKPAEVDEPEINAAVSALVDTIDSAAAAKTPEGDAFLKALEYAGVNGAGAALLQFVNSPHAFRDAEAPGAMIVAALEKGAEAIRALDARSVGLQAHRAAAAAKLSHHFEPPLLVADLVRVYRTDDRLVGLAPAEKDAVAELLGADDFLQAMNGHRTLISESLRASVAAAQHIGVDLKDHGELLAAVIGKDWVSQLADADDKFVGPSAVEATSSTASPAAAGEGLKLATSSVYEELQQRVFKLPKSDKAVAPAVDATQAAAQFLAPVVTAKPAGSGSPAERLRAASLASAKLFPTDASYLSDDNGESGSPTPQP